MSHYMTALAMKQKGLKPAAKIVLYWLADHHNETTGKCFPSIARLAELCEMSRRSVEAHLAQLEAAGLIERRQRHRETGGKTSNGYTLRIAETDAQNLRILPAKSAHGGCAKSAHDITLEYTNLGNEHPPAPQGGDGFDDFWKAVPRKVAKGGAAKAYKSALKKASPETLLKGMKAYAESVKHKDPQYIAHPATWLNQERWLDASEPDQASSTPQPGEIRIIQGKRKIYQEFDGWVLLHD